MDPRRLLIAALLLAAALPGQAGVYKWVDENGKVTYTDAPPPGAAGKSEAVEERISVMGMDPVIRAAAERRFAMQAQAEELDWQRRQQILYAQQAAQPPAPAASTLDASYPSYYAPYYYGAAYHPRANLRGRYYGGVIAKHPPRVSHHAPRAAHHSRPGPAARGPGPSARGPAPRTR